uniref:NTF2-related export protein n=1 Tax=Taeniopygia guttata TaxID=59729 RepID=A0A674H812_TAEGU
MGDKPIWEQIGSSFVQHYYQLFDADRTQLGAIYIDASCLTWEGQQFQGKAAIVEKLTSLPFQKIQHSITAQDHQPTPDSCILSMVVGQLKSSLSWLSKECSLLALLSLELAEKHGCGLCVLRAVWQICGSPQSVIFEVINAELIVNN